MVRFRGWRARPPERLARRRAARSRRGNDCAPRVSVACLRRATFDRDVRRWVPTRSAQKRRPARRGIGWALPFDVCATTHQSPERDRQLQEWFGRSDSPLAPKLADDRGGRTELAFLRGRPRSRERLVQGLTFVLRQIVPLVVDDQVKLSALGQPRWLVEAQPPILNTCTQRSHVTTVRRRESYRQAVVGQSRTAQGSIR